MVKVLSTLALKGTLEKLELPVPAKFTFDATVAILPRVRGGEPADFLILTAEAIDALHGEGIVAQKIVLGSSGVGVAVRAGARKPDISSVDSFKKALLEASAVAHSKVGASGLYFAGVLERLEIAHRLRKRVIVEKGPVGLAVARGDAEIGVQQLCELMPVAGIDIVGGLPRELQKLTYFAAGIHSGAGNRDGALALMRMFQEKATREAMASGGIEPA